MIASACCAFYFVLLPRPWAAASTVQAVGFLFGWMIDPRPRGRLRLLMIVAPIPVLMVEVIEEVFW